MAVQRVPAFVKKINRVSRCYEGNIESSECFLLDHLLEKVVRWKTNLVEKFGEKKTVIFIGVHCRRTDYEHHHRVRSGSSLVDHVYFNKAFQIYRLTFPFGTFIFKLFECFFSRDKYNDKHIKVIFLAVSDDDKWIKAGEDLSPTFLLDIFRPTLENIQT